MTLMMINDSNQVSDDWSYFTFLHFPAGTVGFTVLWCFCICVSFLSQTVGSHLSSAVSMTVVTTAVTVAVPDVSEGVKSG